MEDLKKTTEELSTHVGEYLDTWQKLARVTVAEKASGLAAVTTGGIIVGLMAALGLMLAALAGAWWLGDLWQNRVAGFLSMAGLFIILAVFAYLFRKSIIYPGIRERIIQHLYE